ncbi:hypothetical protein [Rhizobium sp. R693]|uniref:hypothetical protein n=1 Tax=Rhizobium sp. R693 TaxID=1764276 RepID=UPI0011320FDB|nr:hypothetical protein [Rhizobium sp. R693]
MTLLQLVLHTSFAMTQFEADIGRVGKLDTLILSSDAVTGSQDFRRQIDAKLIGTSALLQATLSMLIEGKGQIVFVNSSQARRESSRVAITENGRSRGHMLKDAAAARPWCR